MAIGLVSTKVMCHFWMRALAIAAVYAKTRLVRARSIKQKIARILHPNFSNLRQWKPRYDPYPPYVDILPRLYYTVCLKLSWSVWPFVGLSFCLSDCVCLSFYLSVCLSICLFACLSARFISAQTHLFVREWETFGLGRSSVRQKHVGDVLWFWMHRRRRRGLGI